MVDSRNPVLGVLSETLESLDAALFQLEPKLRIEEVGRVFSIGQGIAEVSGLPGVQSEELVRFPGDRLGLAFNLDVGRVGIVLLDEARGIGSGDEVRRTERVLDVPVGESLLGRVVDPLGRPADGLGAIRASRRLPVERKAPAIMDRAPVTVPLQTGLKVVDALIPVGRGQRELIVGDRQTGKTAIATDAIINQRGRDVICVYCGIGQRSSSLAKLLADLREYGALDYTIVVATTEDKPPGLRFVAPYAAISIAEYFRDKGGDALVVLDDLTRHARAYREISLLLRRPPGREAFPGDIFYIHSRLLERATRLRDELGGGSLTALPIVETEAQNISAYIPTNLISITDGQLYVSPDLFQKGIMPAVHVGKSVSRVGGKTQIKAYRDVAGDLRLSYAQFEELETFARFGTRLDEETKNKLARGRRVREILKQSQHDPMRVSEQIAVLLAVTEGLFDDFPVEAMADIEIDIRNEIVKRKKEICEKIERGESLSDEEKDSFLESIRTIVSSQKDAHADASGTEKAD